MVHQHNAKLSSKTANSATLDSAKSKTAAPNGGTTTSASLK